MMTSIAFRTIGRLACVALLASSPLAMIAQVSALKLAVPDQLTPVEVGQVKLAGLLGRHVDSVSARLTNGQREAYLKVFENPSDTNSWRAEHIGKWLETACNTMTYRHDPKLRASVNAVVERLIGLQQPDGWLGSYAPEFRFHHYDWAANADKKYVPFYDGPFYDPWCHYLTMGGLLRYYEITGHAASLAAAKKIADLLIATFAPGKQDLMLVNHDHGFGPAVAVWPVSKLYLLTGDVRYLDFCRYVVSLYGRPGKVPIVMNDTVDGRYPFPDWAHIKHCEFELCLAGLCQMYRGTGDPQFLATPRNLYEGYFAPVNDTMCLHGFKAPPPGMRVPDTYYGFLETCDIVPMLRWYVDMARITGETKYLDAVEWNLYNALLSRDLPDGRVWPGVAEPVHDFFHCCYSMLSVGLSYIPNWACFTTTNGILVNLYESSTLSTQVAGVNVQIRQTTEYPLDGRVELVIKPERPASFDLLLRIPKWCNHAQVLVNGESDPGVKPQSGSFVRINRHWDTASTVTLVLSMPARAVPRQFARTDAEPVFTLERGPLLLALTERHNPGQDVARIMPRAKPGGTVELEATAASKATRTSSIRFRGPGVVMEQASGTDRQQTIPIVLVPYAYSGVSDKPVPPPQEGVFNVYSEDGVGRKVRVEFPCSSR